MDSIGQFLGGQQAKIFDAACVNYTLETGESVGAGRLNGLVNASISEYSSATQGSIYVYATDRAGHRTKRIAAYANADPRREAWYLNAQTAGKPAWSPVYLRGDATDQLGLSASYPLYDDAQRFSGALDVNLSLNNISDFLRRLNVSRSGRVFIVERSGLLIASSGMDKPHALVSSTARRINASESDDPLIRATADHLRQRFGDFQAVANSQLWDFQFNRETHFVQAAYWYDTFGLDWLVVTVVPQSDFMASIDANTHATLVLCLIALVAALVLGIATAHWIMRPIQRLNRASAAIAAGDLQQQVDATPIKELNGLSESFNGMTATLTASFQKLRTSEEHFQSILNSLKEVVWSCTPQTFELLYMNPAGEQVFGQPIKAFFDNPQLWLDIIHPEDRARVAHAYQRLPATGHLGIEYRVVLPSGAIRRVRDRAQAIYDEQGQAVRLDGVGVDITDHQRAEEQLIHNALHDSLTDLPNRSLFMDHLKQALKRSRRQPGYSFTVLFIDLDGFKLVNDGLGHAAGDQLLTATARLLQDSVRVNDIVARLGGDEFTILLDELNDLNEVKVIAERLLTKLGAPFQIDGHTVFNSASLGIVVGAATYRRGEELLRDADIAMYRAKQLGKGRYAIFDPAMYAQTQYRLQLENDLRSALERQELVLHYQPIFALTSGELKGFEALLRWLHPTRGLIPPAEFIPIAETTGLIVPIGEWVLREACRQLRTWQLDYPLAAALTMSVNFASQQFREPQILEKLSAILNDTGVAGSSLCLEITESALMDQSEITISLIQRLKEMGIRLSMDDFGTGYSALGYLHRFPIDILKIDRSFIGHMNAGAQHLAIIRAIITMAHSLGIAVVAEGVENAELVAKLKSFDCEYGQGYFFSRPLPHSSARALIAANLGSRVAA
ncbi:MAG: EAL domain-containing protein [Gammaproteobacteria bacterium]